MKYKYLFGPVNSRRLGSSLGIDLLPYKTCSYDCVYCECGLTTELTTERKEYVPVNEVIAEIDNYLESHPRPDFITFSGSGEPTLHTGLGRIINHIKDSYPSEKVAVLTNTSLIAEAAVQNDLMRADLVVPSLDAISEDVFNKIIRPAENISIPKIMDGLLDFKSKYTGRMVLEIFIIKGINDTEIEIDKYKNYIKKLNPDGVQLNSLDRPAPIEWVEPVDFGYLEDLRAMFKPIPVQVIKRPVSPENILKYENDIEETVCGILSRRPSTLDDLIYAVGMKKESIVEYLDKMVVQGRIIKKEGTRGIFYRINPR